MNPLHGGGPPKRGPRGTVLMEAVLPPNAAVPAPAPHPAAQGPVMSAMAAGTPAPVFEHWPVPQEILASLPSRQVRASPTRAGPHHAEVPFTGQGSVVEWLRYAAFVHRGDKASEKKKDNASTTAVILLVVGICTVWIFGIGLIPIAVAIYLFFRARKAGLTDVEDRRLETLTGTLFAFGPELRRRKPVIVRLDFTGYDRHAAESASGIKLYAQRWLELSLPLEDGSTVTASVTLQVKERARAKRKYTKIKSKQMETLTVRVSPPSGKAFTPKSGLERHRGRRLSGVALARASVQARQAVFVWSTAPLVYVHGRGGWSSASPDSVDSAKLVAAIAASYKLSAQAERGRA